VSAHCVFAGLTRIESIIVLPCTMRFWPATKRMSSARPLAAPAKTPTTSSAAKANRKKRLTGLAVMSKGRRPTEAIPVFAVETRVQNPRTSDSPYFKAA
jgi:hypothetical protein